MPERRIDQGAAGASGRPARGRDGALAGQAMVASLAVPLGVEKLSLRGLKTVAAIRVLALCSRAERDPLLELAHRFGCLATAKALIAFAQMAARFWPEDLLVLRPCCRLLSADEWTLAQLVDAAASGDRAPFARALDGLVRRERHEPLFDRSALLAGMLS